MPFSYLLEILAVKNIHPFLYRMLEKNIKSFAAKMRVLYKYCCRDNMITINEAFRNFLNEQEACLKPETFLDFEDAILLYEEFLEFGAEDFLSEEDRDLYTARHEHENKNYWYPLQIEWKALTFNSMSFFL